MTTLKKNKSIRKYSEKIQELIKREEQPNFKIIVDEAKSLSPHLKPLAEILKQKNTYMSGGLYSLKENGIAIHVSSKLKVRALAILNSLAKALVERGFKFGVTGNYNHHDDKDRDYTIVEINDIKIRLKLREKQSRKIIKNLKDIEDETVRNSHQFGFKPGSSYLIPNGTLYFTVDAYVFNSCTTKWEDEEKFPLEKKLNKLIQDLIIIS